jgi:hypothetical protein
MARMTSRDIEKICSKKGKKVKFSYPGKEGRKQGVLKDRMPIVIPKADGAVPYCDVVDLIEFDGIRQKWIRFGYYRKKKALNWGSQTTLTEPISIWKKIIIDTAKEKIWFRRLLKEIIKEQPKWDK